MNTNCEIWEEAHSLPISVIRAHDQRHVIPMSVLMSSISIDRAATFSLRGDTYPSACECNCDNEGELINQFADYMTNVVSALTARTQLGQIIKRATQKNERFVVGHRGEPSIVIMSMHDYMTTFAPAPAELKAMQATAKKTGVSRLSPIQINRIVSTVRKEHKTSSVKRPAK